MTYQFSNHGNNKNYLGHQLTTHMYIVEFYLNLYDIMHALHLVLEFHFRCYNIMLPGCNLELLFSVVEDMSPTPASGKVQTHVNVIGLRLSGNC